MKWAPYNTVNVSLVPTLFIMTEYEMPLVGGTKSGETSNVRINSTEVLAFTVN